MANTNRTVSLGYMADVKIWLPGFVGLGTLFGVRSGTVHQIFDKHEVGDTLTGRGKTHKAGRYVLDIKLEYYSKTDLVPESSPLFIEPGNEIAIEVWPDGIDSGKESFSAESFTLFDGQYQFDEDGKVTGNVDGSSNGEAFGPDGSLEDASG